MGCGGSKMEDLKLVALCKERKDLIHAVSQHRYTLAAAHISYFRSLKDVGDALCRFVEEELVVGATPSASSSSTASPVLTLPSDEGKGGGGGGRRTKKGKGGGGKKNKKGMKDYQSSSSTSISHSISDEKSGPQMRGFREENHDDGGEIDDSHIHFSSDDVSSNDEHIEIEDSPEPQVRGKGGRGRGGNNGSDGRGRGGNNGGGGRGKKKKTQSGSSSPRPGISYVPSPPGMGYGNLYNNPYYTPQDSYMSYGYPTTNSYNTYYMKKSSTPIPSVIYSEPKSTPIYHSDYTNSGYFGFMTNSASQGGGNTQQPQQGQRRQDPPPPTPPPPEVSAWDFLNPFEMLETNSYYLQRGYGFGYASNSSSPDLTEVREREGIPDLEEETESEISKDVYGEKKNKKKDSNEGLGKSTRGVRHKNVQFEDVRNNNGFIEKKSKGIPQRPQPVQFEEVRNNGGFSEKKSKGIPQRPQPVPRQRPAASVPLRQQQPAPHEQPHPVVHQQRPQSMPFEQPQPLPFRQQHSEPFQQPHSEPFQQPQQPLPFQQQHSEPFQQPLPFQQHHSEPFQQHHSEPFQQPQPVPTQDPWLHQQQQFYPHPQPQPQSSPPQAMHDTWEDPSVHTKELSTSGSSLHSDDTSVSMISGEDVYVKKKGVSFEMDGANQQDFESSKMSSLTSLSANGTRDIKEVVVEIKNEFVAATDYGQEVSLLLEAGKMPYQPRRAIVKVTLRRLMCSSRQSVSALEPSSRSRLARMARNHAADENGLGTNSLVSTLDKLYVWEKKLYKEVKDEEKLRMIYEKQCRKLKSLDEHGAETTKIESTQASIKQLLTKINVSIRAVDAIARRIHQLRDQELQPQLQSLVIGLRRMWRLMLKCHQKQFHAIVESKIRTLRANTRLQKDLTMRATVELEMELQKWCDRFNKWINSQKSYIESLNKWLRKWLNYEEEEETVDGPMPFSPGRLDAPLVFVICHDWKQAMDRISQSGVQDAMNEFISSLHELRLRQEEEIRQRSNAEYTLKNFQSQIQTLRMERVKAHHGHGHGHGHGNGHDEDASSDKGNLSIVQSDNSLSALDDLKVDFDSIKQRVKEERAGHKEAIKLVHAAAMRSIEEGLVPIFEALESFTSEAVKAYDDVRLDGAVVDDDDDDDS